MFPFSLNDLVEVCGNFQAVKLFAGDIINLQTVNSDLKVIDCSRDLIEPVTELV